MKTIAECAVEVLNDVEWKESNYYHSEYWLVTGGDLDLMHEIYQRYCIANGIPGVFHPLNVFQAVRNGLGGSKYGREHFDVACKLNYPGVINKPVRVFKLKPEYRMKVYRS